MDLSIVTTLYGSAPYLKEFHRRASEAADKFGAKKYELIFVNDGSPDDSLEAAIELHRQDPHVVVVDLSRNFGHYKAMMTGLMQARGEKVFLIDCDLEEPPELLETFLIEMGKTGADVVFGQQARRKGKWFERVSGDVFYRLLNWLSPEPMPRNVVTARLMTRRYVQSLIEHRDREVFMLGLWTITGYKQAPVAVVKGSKGETTYSLGRKITILVNAVTSFSNRPLLYIFYLGMLISFLSLGGAAYLIVRRLFFGDYLMGWPSLIVSIWLLGGFTIMCVGIIGVYIAKIFMEVKQRPYTVVRAIHQRGEGKSS
jgi:putative glycosyltransferase